MTSKVGHVVLPVTSTAAGIEFCTKALGFEVRFVDGDRFAALDGGGVTLALAAEAEQVVPGAVAIGVKVDDVGAALQRAVAAGARALGNAVETPHDHRQAICDPDGNIFVLYAPR